MIPVVTFLASLVSVAWNKFYHVLQRDCSGKNTAYYTLEIMEFNESLATWLDQLKIGELWKLLQ